MPKEISLKCWVSEMYHYWTEDQIEFVRRLYPDHMNKEIVNRLKEEYGIETTERKIQNLKSKYGFPNKKFNPGRFRKGQVPHNKGKPAPPEVIEKVKVTWFRKGREATNRRPVGSVRVDSEGYHYIKVADPDVWNLKHRELWEQHHGRKLEEGEMVVFLDGDRSNFEIENLRMTTRRKSAMMSKKGRWRVGAPDIVESHLNLTELEVEIRDAKKGKTDDKRRAKADPTTR